MKRMPIGKREAARLPKITGAADVGLMDVGRSQVPALSLSVALVAMAGLRSALGLTSAVGG
jgi:hypothetical protein